MLLERENAKYPFLKSGIQLVESLNLKLEDFADPNYEKVLERAAERVTEAIIYGEVSAKLVDPITEILSFPIAIMFVSLIGEHFLNRRYALAEAVRAYKLLQNEYEEKILQIAATDFNWDIKLDPEYIDGQNYTLTANP